MEEKRSKSRHNKKDINFLNKAKTNSRKEKKDEELDLFNSINSKEIESCKLEIDKLEYEKIKSYYELHDLSFLKYYKYVSNEAKMKLMSERLTYWRSIFRSENINQCLVDLGLDKFVYEQVCNYFAGNDNLSIQTDIFLHIDLTFPKFSDHSHLTKYEYMLDSEKKDIICTEYYLNQLNRIATLAFPMDIYQTIISHISLTPKILLNMALVSKSFYDLAKTICVHIKKVQVCSTCNICIFTRSIAVQCITCHEIESKKYNCVDRLVAGDSVNWMGRSYPIEIIRMISRFITPTELITMASVNKYIYNMVKTIVVPLPKGRRTLCLSCHKKMICVSERSMIDFNSICGSCRSVIVYPRGDVPGENWTACCICLCEFFVKRDYMGYHQKCLCCRSMGCFHRG
jgi:hypothetical protein